MQVITLVVGELDENCFIIFDEDSKEAIIIDPGYDGVVVEDKVRNNGLKVKCIVNTHGHYDHVGADHYLALRLEVPVYVHPEDVNFAKHSANNYDPGGMVANSILEFESLTDGQQLTIGATTLTVMHTPGHTEGCICLYTNGHIFVGDLLFAGSIGRTDLPGGSFHKMHKSLLRVVALPENTIVYPGHYGTTTIAQEKRSNPYIAELGVL